MSVKLELYRVFKEVAEVGNITAAAKTGPARHPRPASSHPASGRSY